MNKQQKVYLMLGGTFLPAFISIGILSMIRKEPISFKNTSNLLLFAVASAVGGFVTARMIKD